MAHPVLGVVRLGFPWQTADPFLFCAYHDDAYPAGTDTMGPPTETLVGRNIGSDFEVRDGWRMYHGDVVPGFPRHPHRGFETITLARQGFIDHSDSLGAKARFGQGDVQWMTAGRGIEHCEMFPLLDAEGGNHAELFQIWLNLPASDKLVEPHFTMLWSENIPRETVTDAAGRSTEVVVVAGQMVGARGPTPPPNSWASRPGSDVTICTIRLQAHAQFTLPAAPAGTTRVAYFFEGTSLAMADRTCQVNHAIQLQPDAEVPWVNGPTESQVLILQGRPIGEPVAHQGPFVMNTRAELQQAYADYRGGRFGTWPWSSTDPVHDRHVGRFAVHADGRSDTPPA